MCAGVVFYLLIHFPENTVRLMEEAECFLLCSSQKRFTKYRVIGDLARQFEMENERSPRCTVKTWWVWVWVGGVSTRTKVRTEEAGSKTRRWYKHKLCTGKKTWEIKWHKEHSNRKKAECLYSPDPRKLLRFNVRYIGLRNLNDENSDRVRQGINNSSEERRSLAWRWILKELEVVPWEVEEAAWPWGTADAGHMTGPPSIAGSNVWKKHQAWASGPREFWKAAGHHFPAKHKYHQDEARRRMIMSCNKG
ncbi:uncharacterized protein LOC110564285 [Meriones unguiculatus]|uniref:uncharacterized protein LOC110564285 n=1 Tax=Meriones unguiculatus TaxID=10047 RepID=UPI00293E4EF7|nr:uncharacterized protein LOC110564285 [Meriones unguiculatus]